MARSSSDVYELLRQLCLTDPLAAKSRIAGLLESDDVVLRELLAAAAEHNGARVRQTIARAAHGHRHLPNIADTLRSWRESETDEFTAAAIDDALGSSARPKQTKPTFVEDLPDIAFTYDYVSRRLRHRVLNAMPRAGFEVRRIQDAVRQGMPLDALVQYLDKLWTALRSVEEAMELEAEASSFRPTPRNLDAWVRDHAIRFAAVTTGVEFRFDVEADEHATVLALDYLLDTIFRNLWRNSIEATPGNTIISVIIRTSADAIIVSVIDNGYGFSTEDVHLAFQMQYSSSGDPLRGRGHMEVADAMTRLGGRATIAATPLHGFRVALRFPRHQ